MSLRSVTLNHSSMKRLAVSIQKDQTKPNKYKCIPHFGNYYHAERLVVAAKPFLMEDEVIVEFEGIALSSMNEQELIDTFLRFKRQSHSDRLTAFNMVLGRDNE